MTQPTPFERLMETHPGAEIWWDSSPLIYDRWAEGFLQRVGPERAEALQKSLKRLFDSDRPGDTLFRGVTTNPPLSLNVMKARGPYVDEIVDRLLETYGTLDRESLFWMTYKEIIRRGAEMFLEVFRRSGFRYGYLSGQVDPRHLTDAKRMIEEALDLASLGPNVMIKVPGTKEGYEVIRFLTSLGIPTNNTLTFVLPQLMACAKAVQEGLEIAKKNGVDLSRWRSVITHMTARYGDLGDLRREAEALKIDLTEADVRWAEIAIFKKAYWLLKERGYPSKMLICSMRIGPVVDGRKHCWHLEKLAGGDIVFTCPPPFIEAVFDNLEGVTFTPQIDAEVPRAVLDKLRRIPYFERAYDEEGYTPDQFISHPAMIATAREFSKATEEMVEWVGRRLLSREGSSLMG
ncbi:MAG: transaldolase [Desulfobacterota bacterium]|nr:transaldolase [Thermodesulfobacteriota bacterium]